MRQRNVTSKENELFLYNFMNCEKVTRFPLLIFSMFDRTLSKRLNCNQVTIFFCVFVGKTLVSYQRHEQASARGANLYVLRVSRYFSWKSLCIFCLNIIGGGGGD